MKKIVFCSVFLLAAAAMLFPAPASGQSESFSSPDVDYSFDIPDARWKVIRRPTATDPTLEMVFVDRTDGLLSVRRLALPPNTAVDQLIRDEEQKLLLLRSYVAGKNESFAGHLRGTVFNYEYLNSGRPMSGRFYFLKAADDTVYLLRFTGFTDRLRSIRHQTDSIARTFRIK